MNTLALCLAAASLLRLLGAQLSPGAVPLVRLTNARNVVIRGCSPKSEVATLLRLGGEGTRGITLADSDLGNVREAADTAADVPKGALVHK